MNTSKKTDNNWFFMLSFFLLAFSNGLFSVCIFRILSFTSPSIPMILTLLASCLPIGGFLASRYLIDSRDSFTKSILIVKIAFLLSCLSFTFCLKIAEPVSILFLLFVELILFSPFFIAWGIWGYCGYKLVIKQLKRKEYFYAVFILGILCAYFFSNSTFTSIGFAKTVLLAFLVLLCAEFLLSSKSFSKRYFFKITCVIVLYFLFTVADFDDKFILFIQSNAPFTTKSILNGKFNIGHITGEFKGNNSAFKNAEILTQRWTKYCHLSLIKSGQYLYGLYNGRVHWFYINGLTSFPSIQHTFESLPFLLIPENSSIAIVGAGGGMQVKNALFFNPKEIVAIELIPEVFDSLKNECPESNECIYLRKNVKCVAMEGGKYFERTNQKFDLIYSANTESEFGLLKIFFEPSQLFHTVESFRRMKDKLNRGGIVAIRKEGLVYREDELFKRYFVNLQKAGFITSGYFKEKTELNNGSFILIGQKDYVPNPLVCAKIEKQLFAQEVRIIKSIDNFIK